MITREYPVADVQDWIMDTAVTVNVESWRHGTIKTFVFEHFGDYWQFNVQVHHTEGMQLTEPIVATQVHQVERLVKMWEPVPL